MKTDQPSFTAAYVAAARALGALLPAAARLSEDPFGARFAGASIVNLVHRLERAPGIVRRAALAVPGVRDNVLWQQIRTRVLDDELLAFTRGGGRQVLLLGAGFDCRAARFASALRGSTVFEVDYPATQTKKRAVLRKLGASSARVAYLPWDFEGDRMGDLPARLAEHGHDRALPTLTLWEGVTMYLTPAAIDATVAAVRALSCPGSRLAFTYLDREVLERPPLRRRLAGRFVARVGEPFRFGWDPASLPAWLTARGFSLQSDNEAVTLAERLLPREYSRALGGGGRHIAVAHRDLGAEAPREARPGRRAERGESRDPDEDRDRGAREPDRARDREEERERRWLLDRERERREEQERAPPPPVLAPELPQRPALEEERRRASPSALDRKPPFTVAWEQAERIEREGGEGEWARARASVTDAEGERDSPPDSDRDDHRED